MSKKCCCGGPSYCDVCTHGGYTAQVTITGFAQTNYPTNAPDPPCPCDTFFNGTYFMSSSGTGFIIPCGYSLTHGVAEGGASCCYGYTGTNYCEYNYPFYVMYRNLSFCLYQNDIGGVSIFFQMETQQSDPTDGLVNRRYFYQELQLTTSPTDTLNCEGLSLSLSPYQYCDNWLFDTGPVWCNGPGNVINVLIEFFP